MTKYEMNTGEMSERGNNESLAEEIRQSALSLGYAACGFTDVTPFKGFQSALDERTGQYPETRPLYDPMRHRVEPKKGAPWAESIVVCVRPYNTYRIPREIDGHIGRNYLFDKRVPQCPGYSLSPGLEHVFREHGIRFKRGGVPDRAAAARAGVARIARNGFAVHRLYGSWINIESWRIDAKLPSSVPDWTCPCPDECRLCVEACPTGALTAPFLMRMDRCVAYLTYHAPRPIPGDLWQKMGPWIYGCDDCQSVCPLNHGRWWAQARADWLEDALPYLTPSALADLDEDTYRNIVHPLFWYISVDDAARWRANARRALQFAKSCGESCRSNIQ